MTPTPLIVGAGLAGLLAAHAWPMSRVIDGASGPRQQHRALLRFRTDKAARLTGTEFRKVLVHKGIWARGQFRPPDIELCNLYSQKTLGVLRDRSIWNLAPVERYVAPESWYEQLLDAVESRIEWGRIHLPDVDRPPIVSTAPMPLMVRNYDVMADAIKFLRIGIRVKRWRIPDASVHQTVYFPHPETSIYRASITGSMLIVEETFSLPEEQEPLAWVRGAFGLDEASLEPLDSVDQSYGKVDELDASTRKSILLRLTAGHGVYSLGRFATWRNILLDDVVDDIAVIKRLINQANHYDLTKFATT